MVQPLRKTVWQFLKKLNIKLPYYPALTLLGIYSRKLKADLNRHLYTHVPGNILHNKQQIATVQVFSKRGQERDYADPCWASPVAPLFLTPASPSAPQETALWGTPQGAPCSWASSGLWSMNNTSESSGLGDWGAHLLGPTGWGHSTCQAVVLHATHSASGSW